VRDKPITEERVAAAFEAWEQQWDYGQDGVCPWPMRTDTVAEYANTLAAGLFKYLEQV